MVERRFVSRVKASFVPPLGCVTAEIFPIWPCRQAAAGLGRMRMVRPT